MPSAGPKRIFDNFFSHIKSQYLEIYVRPNDPCLICQMSLLKT